MKITKGIQKLIDDAVYAERKRIEESKRYNGYVSYATWRVNLELIDGMDENSFGRPDTLQKLADAMEKWSYDVLGINEVPLGKERYIYDYAMAFLNDVDWREIAKAFTDDNEFVQYDPDGYLIESTE